MRRQRGAALLLVMWLVLLLSGLVAAYAMSARIESLQGNGAARGVVAGEAARAGVELAASRLPGVVILLLRHSEFGRAG